MILFQIGCMLILSPLGLLILITLGMWVGELVEWITDADWFDKYADMVIGHFLVAGIIVVFIGAYVHFEHDMNHDDGQVSCPRAE